MGGRRTGSEGAINPELCASCDAQGTSCCRRARIALTRGDVERIAAATGADDFFTRVAADAAYREENEFLDPAWARLFAAGDCRVVARRANGDCLFLEKTGCSLPMATRPLVCRLYPFDYTPEAIKGVHGHLCPEGVRENAPLLLALLGMDRTTAEAWRRALYREIAEEYGATEE